MLMKEFVHLHVHSEYSLLDGYSRIEQLVDAAAEKGMKHLALTDHGTLYGIPGFYKACISRQINPVLGVEAYLCENMADHSRRYAQDYSHLLLLAENDIGYSNLLRLTTLAHTQGWHLKPRIDREVLTEHANGLFVTSSCLSGEIPKLLLAGRIEEAYRAARWYCDVFGADHFYLEVQDHGSSTGEQTRLNQLLFQMHRDCGYPLVLTNDLHYVERADADPHDVLLCVQTGKRRNDSTRTLRFEGSEFYLKGYQEMERLFSDLPDAIANTVRIAERCCVDPFARKAELPTYFPIPPQYTKSQEFLYDLCLSGARERLGNVSESALARLDYEFQMIASKGFVDYFLIQWDVVRFARAHGIRCCARGSAAGSLLAYALGITNVDPLRYSLLFERFFNSERSDMPDIDMDYPDDKRDEVIGYVMRKYGANCVAQMITFSTMGARAAIKDVARALGMQEQGERIVRAFPKAHRGTLAEAYANSQELTTLSRKDARVRELMDMALKLEGSVRNTGVHAAGVVISSHPLESFVPLQLRDTKDAAKGRITQYEQKYLEELGLIKFDFLGLANLTILRTTVEFIQATCAETLDLDRLPLIPLEGDETHTRRWHRAFDLLASGDTTGVFQLEGVKMREYIKLLKPTCIEDLTAMVALYRPGPMDSIPDFIDAKHGRRHVTYPDKRLAQWLEESYGVIVYQDQVLQIAVNLAGFSWGKVNTFRKALSKKLVHEIEKYRKDFVAGCVHNSMSEETARQLFTLIEPFGGYGFNKAHAASYAVVAYHCAYLKANFASQFMAATLSTHASDAKKVARDIAECRRMGIGVLGPDVNCSQRGFSVERDSVRFGLLAIRGIGQGPIEEIIRVRTLDGPFTSLADFCKRVDPKIVGRSVIETLVKTGALDCTAPGLRHALLASIPSALAWGKAQRTNREMGMLSLFGDLEESTGALSFSLDTSVPPWTQDELLTLEHQLLGVYLSGHPLQELATVIEAWATHTTGRIGEELEHQGIVVGGLLTEVKTMTTKKGEQMCSALLEDFDGAVSVTVFPRTYSSTKDIWQEGVVLLVEGAVQVERDEESGTTRDIKLLCNRAYVFEALDTKVRQESYSLCVTLVGDRITLDEGEERRALSQQLLVARDLLASRPGHDHLEFIVEGNDWQATLKPLQQDIEYSHDLVRQLIALLGDGAIRMRIAGREKGDDQNARLRALDES